MDLRIAARVSIPIAAVAVLGAIAIGQRAAQRPEPLAKAPAFVANCDRMDYAALEERFGGYVTDCVPGQFGEPAAVVMIGQTMHVIGRDLRELVAPRDVPAREWPPHDPHCSYGLDAAYRVTDLDGDGVDEVIDWMHAFDDMTIRVIAIRDGKLAISREHRYPHWTDPMAASRAILKNCRFD